MSTKAPTCCRDCGYELSAEHIRRIGTRVGLCEPCREKHKAAWREEHTRQGPGDKRRGWLIGDECQVTLKGETYDAKILDMSDVSRHENNYDLMKLELTKTYRVKGWGNEELVSTRTWVHPEPVQSYKLKKRQPWVED